MDLNLNLFRLMYVLISIVLIILFHIHMILKVIPRAGNTRKMHSLHGGTTFRITRKQLACVHAQIWLMVVWLLLSILLFELSENRFSAIISEWKYFFLFTFCFFLAIDIALHFVLVRSYLYLSDKEVNYRFGFIGEVFLPIVRIKSINSSNRSYEVNTIMGTPYNISWITMNFLSDVNQLRKLLEELKNIIAEQQNYKTET